MIYPNRQARPTLTCGTHAVNRRAQLESVVGQVMQSCGGAFLYPTLYLMAGALLRLPAENQPFTDGNKRVAWAASMLFREINGVTVTSTTKDAVDLMLKVARKESDVADIAEFLEKHTTAVTEEARTLLNDDGC